MCALEWFFNGVNNLQGADGWPQIKDGYGEFNGYLPEYDAVRFLSHNMCNFDHTLLNMAFDAIENGVGTGIILGWYDDGARMGGHSIAMWGYICDRDLDRTDTEYCKAIIVSDSDSDIKSDANRRAAPNKLHVLNMSYCTDHGLDSWRFDDYNSGNGILDEIILCEPYNDSLPKETDADASLNKFTAPDFCLDEPCMASDKYSAINGPAEYLFADYQEIYLLPGIQNYGKDLDGDSIAYSIAVMNKADNSTVYENTLNYTVDSEDNLGNVVNIGRLNKGEYKAVFNVNPDKTQPEAYYYNNVYEYDFTVTDGVDVSGVTLAAGIGAFEEGAAPVTLDIAGLETLDIPEGAELKYDVYAYYYVNGQLNGIISDVCGGDSAPTEGIVNAYGESVIFRLKISDGENSFPVINIYSENYPLSYTMFEAVSETGELTPIDRGEKKLADGEEIKFRIKNVFVGNAEPDKYTVTVYADNGMDERIELFSKVGKAPAIGDEGDLISFDSWDAELSGIYSIIAEIEGFDEYRIGTLRVRETPSANVTSAYDETNEYDGLTTLREAVSYAAENGETVTVGNDIGTILLGGPIDIDSGIKIKALPIFEDADCPAIVSENQTRLFNISESGSLDLYSLLVGYGTAVDYGGASLIGCILSGNDYADVSGNTRLYGCCYSVIEKGAQTDSLSSARGVNEIFVTGENGDLIWDMETSIPSRYTPRLSPLAGEGVYVKNNNGMISISADDSEWFDTDVPSPFTDAEYSLNCVGAEHGKLFGSYNSFADYYKICGADEERAVIYSPANTDAELIISAYDYDGNLTGATVTPVTLNIGTNTIYVSAPSTAYPNICCGVRARWNLCARRIDNEAKRGIMA